MKRKMRRRMRRRMKRRVGRNESVGDFSIPPSIHVHG